MHEITFPTAGRGISCLLLSAGMLLTGCYDDSDLRSQLESYKEQLDRLESQNQKQDENINSLKAIVEALNARDYVTGIKEIQEGGKVVGYAITFYKSGEVKIYHGKDGAPGQNGNPGQDGAPGKDGDSMFSNVTYDKDYVYLTLTDGTTITLPRKTDNQDVVPDHKNNTEWVYGLANMPATAEWPIVENCPSLNWDAAYGWFDCNKEDINGEVDSKLCWAASASNMIHWWLKVNDANIKKYNKYTGPQGYTSSTNEEIFKYFKSAFFNNGNPVHCGINWFMTGLTAFGNNYFQGPNKQDKKWDCGFLKEVLGEGENICEYFETNSTSILTEKIKDALTNNKCISLVHEYGGIPHAINMWGAEFDSNGALTYIYITDNNDRHLESKAGLIKRAVKDMNGTLRMPNWNGDFTIDIQAITLLGTCKDKWDTYFASHK